MGIAYSPPDRVVHADIDASTSHCLRQGLHTVALLAGWAVDRATEEGYVYILTSPQDASLECKVQIEDTGGTVFPGNGCIGVRFLSMSEEFASPAFPLRYGPPYRSDEPEPGRLRVHATPCQLFTYYPGKGSGLGEAQCIMGGIPFIDPNALEGTAERCADEDNGLKTTQAFWFAGDTASCLRNSWKCNSSATLHNTAFTVHSGLHWDEDALLRMLPVQRPAAFQERFGNINAWYPVMMRWTGTEEPLCWDPFIAWHHEHPVKVRGQLWDALVRTRFAAWESPLTFDDLAFFSYSNGKQDLPGHVYSAGDLFTLYLRDPGLIRIECDAPEPGAPAESNYAY
jgi:hypothetical protein